MTRNLTIFLFIAVLCTNAIPQETPSAVVDCGSLTGLGKIRFTVKDRSYLVEIKCGGADQPRTLISGLARL